MFKFVLLSALTISTIFINLANASQDNNMCSIATEIARKELMVALL